MSVAIRDEFNRTADTGWYPEAESWLNDLDLPLRISSI
jgi:hypothetical protein